MRRLRATNRLVLFSSLLFVLGGLGEKSHGAVSGKYGAKKYGITSFYIFLKDHFGSVEIFIRPCKKGTHLSLKALCFIDHLTLGSYGSKRKSYSGSSGGSHGGSNGGSSGSSSLPGRCLGCRCPRIFAPLVGVCHIIQVFIYAGYQLSSIYHPSASIL